MDRPANLKLVIAGIVLAILSAFCATLILTGPTAHLASVPLNQVKLFPPSELGLPRQSAAADQIFTLDQKRVLSKGAPTQFQIAVEQAAPKNGAAFGLIITGLGAPGTLFHNAIGLAQSRRQVAPSTARGGHWLAAQLPAHDPNAPQSRLDLVAAQGDIWGTGIGTIKVGSPEAIEKAIIRVELAQQIRLFAFGIVGLFGIGFSIFCLAIPRTFWAGASGLLFGCVLLAWCGSHTIDVGVVTMTLVRLGYLLGAFAAIMAARTFGRTLAGVWLGLASFAIIGALLVNLGWNVGASFDVVAIVSEIAPIAVCGIGLPLSVTTIATRLVKERAEARDDALAQAEIVHAQAQQLERQADRQAVTDERKRFARDIHDGIGGQLVSLLWRVRAEPIPQEELAAEIEQGLADLRLVVDALDDGPVSLPIALANFSYRAREQLAAANIAFEWDLPRDFDVAWSDSRQILSLYRILQETVSNVMRHAQAKTVTIRFRGPTSATPDTIHVTIEDDGKGFDLATIATGRGLANMRTRASQIGGDVTMTSPILPIDAPNFGTRITIILPTHVKASTQNSLL